MAVGHLNVLLEGETLDVLAREGVTDLVGGADTRTSKYRKSTPHASYMLVSDASRGRGVEIVATPEVSDLRPVVLDL